MKVTSFTVLSAAICLVIAATMFGVGRKVGHLRSEQDRVVDAISTHVWLYRGAKQNRCEATATQVGLLLRGVLMTYDELKLKPSDSFKSRLDEARRIAASEATNITTIPSAQTFR